MLGVRPRAPLVGASRRAAGRNVVTRLGLALAALVLQIACTDRTLGDSTEHTEPADERTNDEVLRDFCELWVACDLDSPVLDWPTCLWYFDFITSGFEMDPEKPPECAVAIWDELACASEMDSCEEFKAAWFYRRPDTNHHCDEPFARFNAADCGP